MSQKIAVDNGTDALSAMKKIVSVEGKSFLAGTFVTKINGMEAGPDEYWALFVNGKYADQSVDQIRITQDTAIEWKKEKIETTP